MVIKKNSLYGFIITLCLIFAAIVSINSDSLNRIALYVAIPFAFFLSCVHSKSIAPNRYVLILLLLYFWDFISCIWASYPTSSKVEMNRILGAILLSYIFAANGSNYKLCKYLYIVYIVLYLAAWYYASNNMSIATELSSNDDRMSDEKLNANTMSYYTFYTTTAIFLLSSMFESKRIKRFMNILFVLMIPVSLVVALITASRQVLLIQIPLFVFLLFERYIKQANLKKRVISICFIALVVIYAMPKVIDIINDSFLIERAETRINEDIRWYILKNAIDVGMRNFPLGVGAGNFIHYSPTGHFSHCSYTEIFANTGIIGLLIYCCLIGRFLRIQWKYYKKTKDRIFIIFLLFGLVYTFYQFFYVFYNDLWLIGFFVLVATHSDAYYHRLKMSR